MDRLTTHNEYDHGALSFVKEADGRAVDMNMILEHLAAYEDTGLTPEQVKTAIRIAERVATADYPHNFQRQRRDIVDYMNWITDVMRDAKAWWNGRIKDKGEP